MIRKRTDLSTIDDIKVALTEATLLSLRKGIIKRSRVGLLLLLCVYLTPPVQAVWISEVFLDHRQDALTPQAIELSYRGHPASGSTVSVVIVDTSPGRLGRIYQVIRIDLGSDSQTDQAMLISDITWPTSITPLAPAQPNLTLISDHIVDVGFNHFDVTLTNTRGIMLFDRMVSLAFNQSIFTTSPVLFNGAQLLDAVNFNNSSFAATDLPIDSFNRIGRAALLPDALSPFELQSAHGLVTLGHDPQRNIVGQTSPGLIQTDTHGHSWQVGAGQGQNSGSVHDVTPGTLNDVDFLNLPEPGTAAVLLTGLWLGTLSSRQTRSTRRSSTDASACL